ncbi:MAG: hypothetical protein WCH31_00375 [Actinomycetes bacterium]
MRYVGERLWAELGPSLLPAAPGPPDLTLDLWDGSEVALEPTAPPNEEELHVQADGTRFGLLAGGALLRHAGPAFDVMFDRSADRLVGWIDPGRLAPWERLRPLQELFIAALGAGGRQTFHAAMVSGPGGGVLLPGASGSGKSTVSAAVLAAGLNTLGDDAIAVRFIDGGAVGYALQAVVKLSLAGIAAYPALARRGESFVDPLGEERALRFPDLDGAALAQASLTAIVFPQLVDVSTARLTPLSASVCAGELLRSLLFVEHERVADVFALATTLAAEVPAYRLEVGRDPATIVPELGDLLGRAE